MDSSLPSAWTFWFYHRDKTVKFNNYLAGTHEIVDFDTPAKFWKFYAHLSPVTSLNLWSEYQIFRKGVKPMWEDPHNANGGRWSLRLKLRKGHKSTTDLTWQQRYSLYVQDQAPFIWEQLVLQIITGTFSQNRIFDDKEVLGVVVSVRREEYVISIWNRTSTDAATITALRATILDVCEIDENEVTLEYSPHSESLTKVAEKSKTRGNFPHSNNHNHHHLGQNRRFNGDFKKKWHHDE